MDWKKKEERKSLKNDYWRKLMLQMGCWNMIVQNDFYFTYSLHLLMFCSVLWI